MAEYIERKRAVVDACNALELYPSEYAQLEDALNKVPAADVAPVKHGRWILVDTGKGIGVCSNCNRQDIIDHLATHCRFCGARMDGGRKDNGC